MLTSFHSVCPDIAGAETRTILIPETGFSIPAGKYVLVEYFCPNTSCDCRRVVLQVKRYDANSHPTDVPSEAVLTYGWQSKARCREWFNGTVAEEDLDYHLTWNLEQISEQGEHAQAWLALLKGMFARDVAYVDRLKKHYRIMRVRATQTPNAKQKFKRF